MAKPKFSERLGMSKPRQLQVDGMDEALRNSIWNLIVTLCDRSQRGLWVKAARSLAAGFFKHRIDEVPTGSNYYTREWLKELFDQLEWVQVYDLLEYMVENPEMFDVPTSEPLVELANAILEKEMSGFRFVDGALTPISDSAEVRAIDDAIDGAKRAGLDGAATHLHTALECLGRRPEPDYRNAIKEAISAVESASILISGAKRSTLDPALELLASKTNMHGALKVGFSKLYGYTSDEDGIRHALIDAPDVGFAEAKFMVVACSAFVHYLIMKGSDAGLLTERGNRQVARR